MKLINPPPPRDNKLLSQDQNLRERVQESQSGEASWRRPSFHFMTAVLRGSGKPAGEVLALRHDVVSLISLLEFLMPREARPRSHSY